MPTPLHVEGNIPEVTLQWRLRIARVAAGLEQSELADLLGIALRSIGNYELGHTVPKRPVLAAWAMATGTSLDWLQTGATTHAPTDPCPTCGQGVSSAEQASLLRNRCCELIPQDIAPVIPIRP